MRAKIKIDCSEIKQPLRDYEVTEMLRATPGNKTCPKCGNVTQPFINAESVHRCRNCYNTFNIENDEMIIQPYYYRGR